MDTDPTAANDSEPVVSADSPVVIEGDAVEAATEQTDAEVSGEADPAGEPDVAQDSAIPGVLQPAVEPQRPAPQSAPTPPRARSGGSVAGMIFGGLVAGLIGFAVAAVGVPRGWFGTADAPAIDPASFADAATVKSLAAEVEALRAAPAPADGGIAERLDAISAELETLRAAPAEATPPVDLGPLQDALAAVEARLGEIERRVGDLEARPSGPDGSAAMEAQLEAFRSQLDTLAAEAKAEVEAARSRSAEIEAAAAAAAEAARREAALAEIRAALDSGAPFAAALDRISGAPESLTAVAGEGVVTLLALQRDFPDAARQALAAAQAAPEDAGMTKRFTAFLRRQTNARSLAPREGADADAVLSRAEAALGAGDLGAALAELGALPEAARTKMADWIDRAEARAAAVGAVASLSGATN